jgi:hypothetical protein
MMLAGLVALPFTAAPAMAGTAPAPDETFALIEVHRAARAALNAEPSDEPDVLAPLDDAEEAAMTALVEREPTTLPGLLAFAVYFDQHIKNSGDWESAEWALATVAEACRRLIPVGA